MTFRFSFAAALVSTAAVFSQPVAAEAVYSDEQPLAGRAAALTKAFVARNAFIGALSGTETESLETFAGGSASVEDGLVIVTPTPRDVPAIPEPETYALMLAGLAAVGAIARRRKQR